MSFAQKGIIIMYGETTHKEFNLANQTKTGRIDIRLMPSDKDALELAASLKRMSLSQYILSAALEAARNDIEKEERIKLSEEEFNTLLSLLENPPEPTEALRRLFR